MPWNEEKDFGSRSRIRLPSAVHARIPRRAIEGLEPGATDGQGRNITNKLGLGGQIWQNQAAYPINLRWQENVFFGVDIFYDASRWYNGSDEIIIPGGSTFYGGVTEITFYFYFDGDTGLSHWSLTRDLAVGDNKMRLGSVYVPSEADRIANSWTQGEGQPSEPAADDQKVPGNPT